MHKNEEGVGWRNRDLWREGAETKSISHLYFPVEKYTASTQDDRRGDTIKVRLT